MPQVVIRTGLIGPDGNEEILQEYLCDWPRCTNVAEEFVGVVVELRALVRVCRDHAARLQAPRSE